MMQKIQILPVFLLGCFVLSCAQKTSEPSNSVAKITGSTSTQSNVATRGTTGSSSSSLGGLGSLQSLLSGLTGGGSSSSSGAGILGGSDGAMGGGTMTGANTANVNAIQWSTRFGPSFLSFQVYEVQKNYLNQQSLLANKDPAKNSDVYECPGDSLLVGFRGVYDPTKGDRQMQAYCQFFEDGAGNPLIKSNCSVVQAVNAAQDANPFSCGAGLFLAGFRATWYEQQKDRAYAFECCELRTQSGSKMVFQETKNTTTNTSSPICETPAGSAISQANHYLGVLDNHCHGAMYNYQTGQQDPAPTAIQTIYSSYMSHTSIEGEAQNDRIWNFQCCQLGVP